MSRVMVRGCSIQRLGTAKSPVAAQVVRLAMTSSSTVAGPRR